MTKINSELIMDKSAELFAWGGFDKFSIRKLAKEVSIAPSVIYHYFENEDVLLKSMFDYLNTELGKKRKLLKPTKTAGEMLRQRIEFQLEHAQEIVAVLKYYLGYRNKFEKQKDGYVPDKSTLHIVEALEFGVETGEFKVKNIADDAKVITHAINGFLLEYYPAIPTGKEKKELVDRIYNFLVRALKGGEI